VSIPGERIFDRDNEFQGREGKREKFGEKE